MDKKMTVSRFRLDFTKLTEEVEITSHGRPIGKYIPRTDELPISKGTVRKEDITRG